MVQLRLAPGTNNETLYGESSIVSIDFVKSHTGLSDFQFTLSDPDDFKARVLDELFLEKDDGTLLFRGQLQTINERDGPNVEPTTDVSGLGPGYKLENSEVVFTVSNQLTHNAIDDFWSNETPFSPTVTTPTVNNTVSGETAQEANTNAEFTDISNIDDDVPVKVRNDNIELTQTAFTQEGEAETTNFNNDSNASDGSYGNVGDGGDSKARYTFTPEHTIPQEDFQVAIRYPNRDSTVNNDDFIWRLDGERLGNAEFDAGVGFVHEDKALNQAELNQPTSDLEAGQQHTLEIEFVGSGTNDMGIDVITPYDTGDRFGGFNYTFDNTVNSTDGYLDGPELFPDAVTVSLTSAGTSWNITDGTLTTSWDDTTNNQKIQLRLSDQTWFPNNGNEDNTTSVTTDFGSEVGSAIQGRATFSRYGSTSGQTPLTGINGQKLQSWEITFDGNDIPVISGSQTFEGTELEVAQQLHDRASMRFTILHNKNSLPVESYRPADNTKSLPTLDELERTTRSDFGDFANHVTVRGKRNDAGDRLSHTVQDDASVNDRGVIHFDRLDPSLDDLNAIKVAARALLEEKLREREDKGEIVIAPQDIAPGFGRDNPFNDDANSTIPIEETAYRLKNGEIQGVLTFDFRIGFRLSEDIGGLNRKSRDNSLGF